MLGGSSTTPTRTRSSASRSRTAAVRSAFSSNYLSPKQRKLLETLLEAEASKAQSRTIPGDAFEEAWAEATGGQRIPARARGQRGPDAYSADGVAYQLKTLGLRPTGARPEGLDWIGQSVVFPLCRVRPQQPLPAGKSIENVSASALGRRVISAYNDASAEWEKMGFLVRLPVPDLQATHCLYWEEEVEPLSPTDYSWRDSATERLSPWDRNLHAFPRGWRTTLPVLSWASGGTQLYGRVAIPEDADLLVINHAMVLSRAQATQAVLAAAHAQLLAA